MRLRGRSNHGLSSGVVRLGMAACCSALIGLSSIAPSSFAQTTDSSHNASQVRPAISMRTRLKAPIHIVPFHEPGAASVIKSQSAIFGAHADYFGGPVIANVHVVQVLYGTGAYLPNVANSVTPNVAGFFTDITQSPYFDMLGEYGTGGVTPIDGAAGTNQILGHGFFDGQFTITPSAANNGTVITDTQIQNELLSQVTAGHLPAPVIDAQGNDDTLYMIFFPPGKTITAGGVSSCVKGGFCAYHNSTTGTFGSRRLFYGVMPDVQPPGGCSTGCGGSGINVFDTVTNVTSHELVEAITDADVGAATTFGRPLAWIDQVNGEIGDICIGQQATVFVNSTPYNVQREFSNFQDDCVAGPAQVFLTAPDTTPGQLFDLDVAVQSDTFQNLTNYTGTIHFASSDPKAVLPPDYTFNFADAGFHTFVVTLNTLGSQTITASDIQRPLLTRTGTVGVLSEGSSFGVAEPANASPGVPIQVFVTARTGQDQHIATGYTGTIHFTSTDSAAVLPPDSRLANGTGAFSITFNTPGSQTLQVTDSANSAIFGNSGSNVAAPPVNPTTTTVVSSANPSTFGQQVTYTATVTQSGVPATTGIVSFFVDGTPLNFLTVDANGQAQTSANLGGGPHIVFAEYSGGGASIPPSSSAPFSSQVDPVSTTLGLSSSTSPSTFGQKVFLTASISSTLGGANGGVVTFTDNGAPLAVVAPFASAGSFADTSLSVGSHTIAASYSGTANFAPSTASSIVQVVNPAPPVDYSITADKTSATILAGQSATFVITTNALNGFVGTVRFSCGNLPALATCTFSPTILAIGSPSVTTAVTTLTIKTTGPHAQLVAFGVNSKPHPHAAFWVIGPFVFGIVLCTGVRCHKRRGVVFMAFMAAVLVAGLASCGGGGSTPPPPPPPPVTPAGTSSVTVSASGNATSGAPATNPLQQVNISLTVQP
jgi:hypothetical protein